jgi:hypothetical protein
LPPASVLEKVLRGLSVFTMLMTVPQVLTIWVGCDAGGILLSHGFRIWSPRAYGSSMRFKSATRRFTLPASAGSRSTPPSWLASSFIAELHQAEAAWHALAVEETAQRLRTDVAQGLSGAEAARRYAQDGPNALPAVKARSGVRSLAARCSRSSWRSAQ